MCAVQFFAKNCTTWVIMGDDEFSLQVSKKQVLSTN